MMALGLWLTLALAPAAPTAEDKAEAKALFEEAAVARREARWADAREKLERALQLYPQFSTAWNLVTAEEQLDDLPAAEALLLRLRDDAYGPLAPKERAAVLERLESVARELGSINLESGEPAVAIEVDGRPRGEADDAGRATLRVPAGTHRVRVTTQDGRSLERSLDVSRAEQRALRFTFPPPALVQAPPPPAPAEPAPESSPPLWLWLGLGALLVVGAAVTTTAVLANQDADPLPADFMAPPL